MLSKIAKKILSVVFTLGLATMAKADTAVFPFTYTVQTGDPITATGSFITDGYGSLGFNDITTWTITFTSTSLPNQSFTLTSLNSQLSFGQDTTINATQSPQNLIIDALDPNGGFGIAGTAIDATGTWNVEWDYANGGAQALMSIDLVGISNTAGFNNLTFPHRSKHLNSPTCNLSPNLPACSSWGREVYRSSPPAFENLNFVRGRRDTERP